MKIDEPAGQERFSWLGMVGRIGLFRFWRCQTYRLMVLFLAYTGVRFGEMDALNVTAST